MIDCQNGFIHIVNFEKHQNTDALTRIRELNAARQERFRSKAKQLQIPADTTFTRYTQCYESNIGILTPIIGDELKLIASEFAPEWFEEAVKEAVTNQVRKLNYIRAILDRWKVDGFKAEKKEGKNNGTGTKTYRGNPSQKPAGAFKGLD